MACEEGQYINSDTNECTDWDFSFLNPYGSGMSSSPDDAPSNEMFTEKDDKPKNGQIVLEQLPELMGGLFGGVAALINATNGTTPYTVNNNYQNTDSDDGKEDKTAAYVLGAVGFVLVLIVAFFIVKSMKSKGNNHDRKSE